MRAQSQEVFAAWTEAVEQLESMTAQLHACRKRESLLRSAAGIARNPPTVDRAMPLPCTMLTETDVARKNTCSENERSKKWWTAFTVPSDWSLFPNSQPQTSPICYRVGSALHNTCRSSMAGNRGYSVIPPMNVSTSQSGVFSMMAMKSQKMR